MKKRHATKEITVVSEMSFEPLSKSNWSKFTELFGERGACGNCWCMYYRLNPTDFAEGKQNNGNKDAMKALVWENAPTGLLGFYEGKAIAWCAFAPREDFPKLARSRVHKPIDDAKV